MRRLITIFNMATAGVVGVALPALADATAVDVPEPASLSVFAVGVGTISLLRRRR